MNGNRAVVILQLLRDHICEVAANNGKPGIKNIHIGIIPAPSLLISDDRLFIEDCVLDITGVRETLSTDSARTASRIKTQFLTKCSEAGLPLKA